MPMAVQKPDFRGHAGFRLRGDRGSDIGTWA
jgi:hypothetical protein